MIDWKKIKYFKPSEFACKCCGTIKVSDALVLKLEKIRGELGVPLRITSAYRCPKHNKAINGKPNSAHLTGDAADIDITNDRLRYKFLALAIVEFDRIGLGSDFIHVDVRKDLDREVAFNY